PSSGRAPLPAHGESRNRSSCADCREERGCRQSGLPAASEAGDLGDELAVVLEVRVPTFEGLLELFELVPAPLEADRLRRLGRHAVLVPRDVPGDGDREFARDSGEWNDARLRVAEALGDPADSPAVSTCVEEVGGLDHREFVLGEAAQDRLGRDSVLARRAAEPEDLAEPAAAAPSVAR